MKSFRVAVVGAGSWGTAVAAIALVAEYIAKTVSVVGGSMGGGAAAKALIEAQPGEIDRLVLLATSHRAFDYALIQQHAQLIVDTRGVYLERLPNVVKA